MTEACAVNRSLSALGNVIEALNAKAAHVPYRDSKLTMILQDVLRSDSSCKMLVLVTISPLLQHAQQTCDALKFGARCRRVELGRAAQDVVETHEQQQRKREAERAQRSRRRRRKCRPPRSGRRRARSRSRRPGPRWCRSSICARAGAAARQRTDPRAPPSTRSEQTRQAAATARRLRPARRRHCSARSASTAAPPPPAGA